MNEQINIEYNVSYIYHAMYAYRGNNDVPGIMRSTSSRSPSRSGATRSC